MAYVAVCSMKQARLRKLQNINLKESGVRRRLG